MSAPNAYKVEQAMSAYQAARARILEDDPDTDLADAADDVMALLERVILAAVDAGRLAKDAAEYAKEIGLRKARFEKRADTMRSLAFSMMDALGERKMERPAFTASISAGRSAVVITDDTKLPADCVRTTTTPDKTAIAEKMKQGEVVDGAAWANSPPVLTIRTR